MSYLAKLSTRGIIATLNGSKIKLSAQAPPGKDMIELIKSNRDAVIAELRDQQDRENIDSLKQTFRATELTGAELLKSEYNFHLAKLRELETYLDNKGIPQDTREESLPAFKKLSHKLSNLLNAIGTYAHEEVANGFEIKTQGQGGANSSD